MVVHDGTSTYNQIDTGHSITHRMYPTLFKMHKPNLCSAIRSPLWLGSCIHCNARVFNLPHLVVLKHQCGPSARDAVINRIDALLTHA